MRAFLDKGLADIRAKANVSIFTRSTPVQTGRAMLHALLVHAKAR
jgi:hypothetical protein